MFELFENEIVPLYYKRDDRELPREWIHKMKESIATLTPMFSTRRMVKEYVTQLYAPAMQEELKTEP